MAFDFQPMLDVHYATFGVAAEYYPAGGPKVSCTVIKRRPEVAGALARSGFLLAAEMQALAIVANVRVSEVALAKKGDTLVIGEQPYTVRDQPELDGEKLEWSLPLKEAVR